MRSFPASALSIVLTALQSVAVAEEFQAPPETKREAVEGVRVQPRGQRFAPGSAEDDDIQRKIDSFNKEQKNEDRKLDSKLTICRRC